LISGTSTCNAKKVNRFDFSIPQPRPGFNRPAFLFLPITGQKQKASSALWLRVPVRQRVPATASLFGAGLIAFWIHADFPPFQA
jgi:hypothetical protein